ncbi:MAG: M14 family zinc carboxypeptidase, partial [Armatimonadota bacterium]
MSALPPITFDHYYRHAELSEHLRQVAAAEPERVRLHSLYTTPEGREEWLVEIGPSGGGVPSYLVHANLHAPEVSGTTAALVLIEQLLTREDLGDRLSEVAFHIIPRLNPDGAEYALVTGGNIRSKFVPRPRKNGLHAQDLNGDGLVLQMR